MRDNEKRPYRAGAAVGVCLVVSFLAVTQARSAELSFRQRVAAQEAIERVYYSHQIGARRPFERAVPEELLARKVRTYLAESSALETFWNRPITAEGLRAEQVRIERDTLFPERLRAVQAALDDDPVLLLECFVRPVLADRTARALFASDERIQGPARREAERLHARLASGALGLEAEHPRRSVIRVEREDAAGRNRPRFDARTGRVLRVGPEELARWKGLFPARAGAVGGIQEEEDAYVIRALVRSEPGGIEGAFYRVPKVSWDDWWERVGDRFARREVSVVASAQATSATQALLASAAASSASCDSPAQQWQAT
ncbi:MAG: hypothetical protein ACE5IK_14035, partial [Acidobacteriota bacterium]